MLVYPFGLVLELQKEWHAFTMLVMEDKSLESALEFSFANISKIPQKLHTMLHYFFRYCYRDSTHNWLSILLHADRYLSEITVNGSPGRS